MELEMSEAIEYLMAKADEVYRKREIRYPVDYILELTNAVMTQNPQAALQQLAGWAYFKFGIEWEPMSLLQRTPQQWGDELTQAAREWIEGDKLDETVQDALQRFPEDEQLEAWLDERFQTQLLDDERGLQGDERAAMIRSKIMNVLRAELIHFERLIMLQVLDQAWKDHLYFMDQLRNSIGFRSFAQKDPRIEYRREGREMYDRMKEAVRDRITDLIFKARLSPNYQPRSHYGPTRAMPRGEQGTGVRAGAGQAPAQAPQGQEPEAAAGRGRCRRRCRGSKSARISEPC
ncbi:MAG: hypothetical protein HND57_06850 [Planctomycetes bacterium]|nr:hypothetical protein [Planctomycetota bacterium]